MWVSSPSAPRRRSPQPRRRAHRRASRDRGLRAQIAGTPGAQGAAAARSLAPFPSIRRGVRWHWRGCCGTRARHRCGRGAWRSLAMPCTPGWRGWRWRPAAQLGRWAARPIDRMPPHCLGGWPARSPWPAPRAAAAAAHAPAAPAWRRAQSMARRAAWSRCCLKAPNTPQSQSLMNLWRRTARTPSGRSAWRR